MQAFRDSNIGVFLWILRNFYEQLFSWNTPGGCFCNCENTDFYVWNCRENSRKMSQSMWCRQREEADENPDMYFTSSICIWKLQLNHFMALISFDTSWKHQKNRNFLMLSGGIKRHQWHEMGYYKTYYLSKSIKPLTTR